jgi:hypothetical protein
MVEGALKVGLQFFCIQKHSQGQLALPRSLASLLDHIVQLLRLVVNQIRPAPGGYAYNLAAPNIVNGA